MALGFRVTMMAVAMASSLCGETLEIEGKLLKATATPTLRQIAPYPRALCTYLYEVKKVHRGKYEEDKILVVKWAVWERKMVRGMPKEVGSVERLKLGRWLDQKEFKRERFVDDIREVDMVVYYDQESLPTHLDKVLEEKGPEMASGVVRGEDPAWLFLAEELRHAETGRFWEKDWKKVSRSGEDPLPAMLEFQKRLKRLGVQLLVVPIPTKVSVHPDRLKKGTVFTAQEDYLEVMKEAGLRVVSLSGFEVSHLQQDTHWTPGTCMTVAELAADTVMHNSEIRPGKLEFEFHNTLLEIRGDLAKMAPKINLAPESVHTYLVHRAGSKKPGVGLTHPGSPVILLGDSHVTVFSEEALHGRGGGLPDWLAVHFNFPVDVIASHGDGVNQARVNLYQQRSINPKYPDYWKNKKAVIWVFAAREFTRAERWSAKIPVVRSDHQGRPATPPIRPRTR